MIYGIIPKESDHTEQAKSQSVSSQEDQQDSGAMEFITKGFSSIWETAVDLGSKAKTSIEEAKIGEKLSTAANVVSEKAMAAGNFMYDKTKEAAGTVKDKTVELAVNIK